MDVRERREKCSILFLRRPGELQVAESLNDTAENFLASIERDDPEVAPSSIYAAAAVLEGVPFINGSPQVTVLPPPQQCSRVVLHRGPLPQRGSILSSVGRGNVPRTAEASQQKVSE